MLCVLWLGSSVGNLKPHEAVGFFQSVQESSGPNTQVSMQPMITVQTHNFTFLPLLNKLCIQQWVKTWFRHFLSTLLHTISAKTHCRQRHT